MKNILLRYFTSHTKNVLAKAQKLASLADKKKVGISDLFVALSLEKGSVSASLVPKIKHKEKELTKSKNKVLPYAKNAQKVLLQSLKAAQSFQFPYVGTEHLLYAVLKSNDKKTLRILKDIKLDQFILINQLEKILAKTTDLSNDPLIIVPDLKNKEKSVPLSSSTLENNLGKQEYLQEIMNDINELIQSILEKKDNGEGGLEKSNRQFMRPSFGLISPKKNQSVKFLDYFARDLNNECAQEKTDPVVGRNKEIDSLIRILMRKSKNNPVLVGEPGVGKTAIVSGLAQRINDRNVPEVLMGKKVMNLDLGLIVAGTSFRGEFEDRLKRVLDEAENDPNIILFIDELHNIIGAGSAQGSLDAANILKPALARGQIRCIGATTIEEYHKYIEKDGALERRFQPIWVKENTLEDTEVILQGLKPFFEQYHRVKISDNAIKKAIELANKFINDRFFPDKALDLLDETAAYVVQDEHQKGAMRDLQKLLSKRDKLRLIKEKMVLNNNFISASSILEEEKEIDRLIQAMNKKVLEEKEFIPVVSETDVAEVLSLKIDILPELILESIGQRLKKLEFVLKESIKGQDEALKKISSDLKRTFSGVSDPERPATAMLLVGPTGVGKTYLAKTLAKELFLKSDSLIRVDMSEFSEKHNISRLVGSPPGYVGYGEKNYFSDKIRKNPYSLILFDEIEKAHPEIFNILLQVLEDGFLTDSLGRKVNFKNTLILFTSNLGNDEFLKKVMGFDDPKGKKKTIPQDKKAKIRRKLEEFLRPELLNRLTDVIYFKPLTKKSLFDIALLEIEKLKKRIYSKKEIELFVSDDFVKNLAKQSLDHREGVRMLRKLLQRKVEDPLAQAILEDKVEKRSKIWIKLDKKNDRAKIKIVSPNKKNFSKFFRPNKKKISPLWKKMKKKSVIA